MRGKSTGNTGIREIAKALNISIGTVDRALHGRSGVSARTREQVLRKAKQLNYSPNLAARHLKLNRRFSVGVFLPDEIAPFFEIVRQGIRSSASTGSTSVDVHFHSYPRIGEGEMEALKKAHWQQYDGIIIALEGAGQMSEFWEAADAGDKPVMLVATDSPHRNRLASVAVDGFISGSIAADLMGRAIPSQAPVAILTGDLRVQDHLEKLRGFAASLASFAPQLTLLPAVETHDRKEEAYEATKRLLSEQRALGGLYVNTANSAAVIRALEESGKLGKVQLITTDLFADLIPLIEQGQIVATLDQRPFTQGRLAFELMASYLVSGKRPKVQTRLSPHIVLRSNLPLFADRVRGA
jgi:LacI family transcriptional regulator